MDWPSIISGMGIAHNEREAKKCEETLKQFSENAQDVLFTQIDQMIYHIGEKVRNTGVTNTGTTKAQLMGEANLVFSVFEFEYLTPKIGACIN